MTTLPVPLFAPDRPRYDPAATNDVLNVVPVAGGYGPLPSLKPFIPAFQVLSSDGETDVFGGGGDVILVVGPDGLDLSGEVAIPGTLGGIFVRLTDGTTALFVGTQTSLYKFNSTDYTWVEIGSGYSVAPDMRWSFALWANGVRAQNFSDPEQIIDVATGVITVSATAPICAYLCVCGPFLVRGRLLENEDAVQWGDLENPDQNEAGIGFSDIQVMPEGSGVRGVIPVSSGVIVPMRNREQALALNLGSSYVFTRQVLDNFRGCIAPYSIQLLGQDDFIFYSQDGWVRGASMQQIGSEVLDRWFSENVNYTDRVAMISGVDYRRKMYWARFTMSDGSARLLGYHYQLNLWTLSDADYADMFPIETQGVTIDQMDSFFDTIDDINVPYDSSFWQGGSPDFAGMDSNGFLAPMNGAPMAWRIVTNDLVLNENGRTFVNGAKVLTDANNYTAQLTSANTVGGTFSGKPPVTPTSRSKFLSIKGDGEAHRLALVGAEDDDWSIIQALKIDGNGSGRS